MIMPTKDGVSKDLIGKNVNFASVCNYYLYKGENVIRPESLHDVDTELRYYDDSASEERKRDMLKFLTLKEGSKARYLFLGIESQSNIDSYMVLRTILYDVLTYLAQLKKEGRKRKLKPVITIIFNCSGKPWRKSLSLYDLIDIPDELKSLFEEYCGNHRLIVFDPYSIEDENLDRLSDEMRMVTKAMKYHNNKKKYYEHMTREEMKDVSDEVYYAITVINNDTETRLIRNRKGRVDMCRATREIAEERRIKWTSEGYSEGVAEGKAEGIAEGIEKGKLETLVSSVKAAMGNLNLSAEAVFNILNVPQELRAKVVSLL